MHKILEDKLVSHRRETYHLDNSQRLQTKEDAIAFVEKRGFVYFWPISDIDLPSLWVAVAGDRPVANEHDDPGHITWGWKDALLGSRMWFYAKILRKKSTMISMQIVPYFYALTENYGSPEEDYLTEYELGRMTQEAKAVYEAILNIGPLDTIALRKMVRMTSKDSDSRFAKALIDLQTEFKLVPVAVAQAGAWRYAFVYDIVSRYYPEIPEKARYIGELQARCKLIELYIQSVGATRSQDLSRLFGWKLTEFQSCLDTLEKQNFLYQNAVRQNHPGKWIGLGVLCA